MDSTTAPDNVDYSLRGMISLQIVCSACLKRGRVTKIPQVVSPRHTPRTLCGGCLKPKRRNLRHILTHLTS